MKLESASSEIRALRDQLALDADSIRNLEDLVKSTRDRAERATRAPRVAEDSILFTPAFFLKYLESRQIDLRYTLIRMSTRICSGTSAALADLELARERERMSAARLEAAQRELEFSRTRPTLRTSSERLFERYAVLFYLSFLI